MGCGPSSEQDAAVDDSGLLPGGSCGIVSLAERSLPRARGPSRTRLSQQRAACDLVAALDRRLHRTRRAWNRISKWGERELYPLAGQDGTADLFRDLRTVERLFQMAGMGKMKAGGMDKGGRK